MRNNLGFRRCWRSATLILGVALFAIIAPASAGAMYMCPASTQYTCAPEPSAHHPVAGEQGWGYVDSNPSCLYATPRCLAPQRATAPVYRWTGSWQALTIENRTVVYVYPFAEGWSWVWTRSTGWLAAADASVWIGDPPA